VSPTTRTAVDWTFVTTSLARPTGGDIALFELANAVSRAGLDRVTLVHMPFLGTRVRSLDDLSWFDFDGAIEHRFADLDPDQVPEGDLVVYTVKLLASASDTSAGGTGAQLIARLRDTTEDKRPSILFLQGLNVFPTEVEELALGLPGTKVCVGSWMVDVLVSRGVARSDVVHVPNGVDAGAFRVKQPIAVRKPRAAMNLDPHPVKNGPAGLEAIELARERSGLMATVFGTRLPEILLPDDTGFVLSPSRAAIVDDVYNASSLFLQPSRREGFGMCAVEAMASGCALVTTANGGSADYAFDGETALVCGPDAEEMAEALVRLVTDDDLRVRIAENGCRFVQRFRWEASAERLAGVADDVLSR
jgi:glycosyltransferase involved in cell wall biosynthesis